MNDELVQIRPRGAATLAGVALPSLIEREAPPARARFLEFFAARIRNPNTRAAYMHAGGRFLSWCEEHGLAALSEITPMAVAAYIESHPGAAPTVKQHLAAIRMCFDWLVTAQVMPANPAHAVKGPSHVVARGKTSVLSAEEAKLLLDAIPMRNKAGAPCPAGLRDRALIGLMVHSFARISAALGMDVEDYYVERGRRWFRLYCVFRTIVNTLIGIVNRQIGDRERTGIGIANTLIGDREHLAERVLEKGESPPK
jgi:integrase